MSQKQPKPYLPYVYYNESILELSKELLMLQDYFEGKPNDDPSLAMDAMRTYDTLVNARFAYGGLRIKIPIMIREEQEWVMYVTFTSCFPKEHEAQMIADMLCVLEALKIIVKQVYVIHLNANYVRGKELNVRELLVVSDALYNQKNHANHALLKLIEERRRDVFAFVPKLAQTLTKEDIPSIRCNTCTRGGKCTYFDTCFPQKVSCTSVLNLVQSRKKYELLAQGIEDIKDVDMSELEGTRFQYAQIMAARMKHTYIDDFAVRDWVTTCIHYPISYLDFEWETYAYPPYHGMKPYDVLVFQYSLHVETEKDCELQHFEFLGTKDCREDFIRHLLKDVPKTGSILVFNMEGAEKLRLKQLAQQFPSYQQELDALCDRMVDLSLPFSTGNIYDSRMEGFYSLKKLVTVFSDYNYQDLDISYGMDAVRAWRLLDNVEDDISEEIQKALYTYCAMDTYAEYIIYHKILALLERG